MSRHVSFHPLARVELLEAAAWYRRVGLELAGAFLDAIERAADAALAHPDGAPLVGRKLRRLCVRRFPYSLLYSVTGDEVRILAVAHQKRRPFYWNRRR